MLLSLIFVLRHSKVAPVGSPAYRASASLSRGFFHYQDCVRVQDRPVSPEDAYRSINPTSSDHGATRFISSRNSRLCVLFGGEGGQCPPRQGGAGSQDRCGRCAVAGLTGSFSGLPRLSTTPARKVCSVLPYCMPTMSSSMPRSDRLLSLLFPLKSKSSPSFEVLQEPSYS
jgi:hypothetical protein